MSSVRNFQAEGTAYAKAQRWEEWGVAHVAGWRSSQKEGATEPGEVSRAWALGSDGPGEKLRLCAMGTGETRGGLSTGLGGRSLPFCWENPSATFWFTRVETDCASDYLRTHS